MKTRTPFVERGAGETLVLIPGVQGRWEWMEPAVSALARRFRVVTFSLLGERGSGGAPWNFDSLLAQVDGAIEFSGAERVIVCGVSYGGLIAVRYASRRPERVERLVLVSTPSPSWKPDARLRRYANTPHSSALAFVVGAPGRLAREISAAIPNRRQRFAAAVGYLRSIVLNPGSPASMAGRVRAVGGSDFVADAEKVQAPTLVITGERSLDRVVPVPGTLEYLALIRGAAGVTLERTGHIGLITRPEAFAEIVWDWTRRSQQ